jgi:NAD-dependent DNA ligase
MSFEADLAKFDLNLIKSNPEKFAKTVTIANGIKFIKLANHYYYGTGEPIVNDSSYDKIEEILKERSPTNKIWTKVRSELSNEKEKVTLPYWMGSMDKIKPGKEQVEKWSVKYPGNYVISEKLDGMSCLMIVDKDNEIKLYTRGDGSVGQDITSLLKYIKHPSFHTNESELAFRGELIISRKKYDEKYKTIKTDPRSMVAGLMNSKYSVPEELKDLDLVIYEIINPIGIKPSKQFEMLNDYGFKTPMTEIIKIKQIDEPTLMKMLPRWKQESKYEIDGLIITQDKAQDRNVDGNPDYSRAFKMDLDEQRGIGEVEEILWEVSRHGKIIPRIKIKPIKIGLVTIQKATAFNAKYILDNKLGPGAVVNIIRSGDVIPYIESIVKEAPLGASMPEDIKYKWHEGGFDIYVDEEGDTDEIEIKKLTYFMTTLEAEGISNSTIKRYYDAGFDDIKSILDMSMDDILSLPNTKEKLAEKQYNVLQEIKKKKHPLEKLMAASGVFGLGMGSRKSKMVLDVYPDIITRKVTKHMIIDINGFEEKSAELFLKGLEKFKKWLDDINLKYTVSTYVNHGTREQRFKNMTIVMTGFRDKELEKIIEDEGGTNGSAVSSKTAVLLAKDVNESGGKLDKARNLKVPIMTPEDFRKKYEL